MRLFALLFTAILAAPSARAQPQADPRPASSDQESASAAKDGAPQPYLPVSLDRIKEGLQRTGPLSLRTLDEGPTFRVQIEERQRIEELLATLNFKAGPVPAGGVYASELQRQTFNPVDNPLVQPYAAFNQPELLTILIENLAGKYLAGRALNAVTSAERARAEAAARLEVRQTIGDYCAAQPEGGAAIQICSTQNQ
jgi:hypothetical protein